MGPHRTWVACALCAGLAATVGGSCVGRETTAAAPSPRTPDGPGEGATANAGAAAAGTDPAAATPTATSAASPDAPDEAEAAEREDSVLVAHDLVHEAALAEVAAPGLRIDFGSGATAAFTLGRWRTGWGRDGEDEGRTVTVAARSPVRLYLPADAIAGKVMRVRAKAFGARRVTAEIAGSNAGDATVPTNAYGSADFDVPADVTGQVTVKLTFRGSGRHARLGRAAALVDRIDFLTAEQAAADAADTGEGPVLQPATVAAAEDDPQASLIQAGDTVLRFHLYVPPDATLRLAPAAPGGSPSPSSVRVLATVDGESPVELLSDRPVEAAVEREVGLSGFAGKAIRLELAVEGDAAVRWIGPEIVVPDRGVHGAPARTARNLVVLLVDTLRADKLSNLNPSTEVRSTNLQRWAAEGTAFADATAQENWTKPSVATLLTGLYPSSHAAQSERSVLSDHVTLMSEVLHDQGFATACFIANGYVSDTFGFRRGWDGYRNYVRAGISNRARNVFEDAAAWIAARRPDERFFLYVQTIDPHVPYVPPREYSEMYDPGAYEGPVKASETAKLLERIKARQVNLTDRDKHRLQALYDGEITYHDDQVPMLRTALESIGALDDTLVVVVADHGEEFFDHGSVGHGHTLYRELLHVPLFMRLPGVFPAGARVTGPVGLVDVLPTALEALGLGPYGTAQGRSLLPLANGTATGTEAAFSEFLEGQRAVTGRRYKLIQRGYTPMLFDLLEDPGEHRDLSDSRPIALRAMVVRLSEYLEWQERAGREEEMPRPAEPAEIDSELEQQLRALGYLGGPP